MPGKDKEDFENGIQMRDLEEHLAEKAEDLNDFLCEITNNRKTGKSATGELSLVMADILLGMIRKQEEEVQEDRRELLDFKDQIKEALE